MYHGCSVSQSGSQEGTTNTPTPPRGAGRCCLAVRGSPEDRRTGTRFPNRRCRRPCTTPSHVTVRTCVHLHSRAPTPMIARRGIQKMASTQTAPPCLSREGATCHPSCAGVRPVKRHGPSPGITSLWGPFYEYYYIEYCYHCNIVKIVTHNISLLNPGDGSNMCRGR
jgi:hypothetical protein